MQSRVGSRTRTGLAVAAMCLMLSIAALAGAAGCSMPGGPPPKPATLYEAAISVISERLSRPVESAGPNASPAALEDEQARHQLQNQAIEIAGDFPQIAKAQWFELGLASRSSGVQYAALLAIGKMADYQNGRLSQSFLARVRELANEKVVYKPTGQLVPRNDFVRLAAGYAQYKLTGDPQAVGFIPDYIDWRGKDAEEEKTLSKLRAETVYVLSLMPGLEPQELLKHALGDTDGTVRVMAQNRLAILGDAESMNATINMIHSPTADDALDALKTLESVKLADLRAMDAGKSDPLQPVRMCLANCCEARKNRWGVVEYKPTKREVAMAAIRTMGIHGAATDNELSLALAWLNFRETDSSAAGDEARDQREARVRILAALALGGIGNYDRSAGPLLDTMKNSSIQRLRLAAARASLEVLRRSGRWPAATESGY